MPEAKVDKLLSRLRLKEFKLTSLLEITNAINDNYPVDRLLRIYEYILREQLAISKLSLFINDEGWKCILKYGTKNAENKIDVAADLLRIREITVIESSSKEYLHVFDIVIPVFHKDSALAYLLIGDLDEEEVKISPTIKHMPFIQTITNIIVVAIENKRLAKDIIRQERMKRELEVAAEMQRMLLPANLPGNTSVEIAGKYKAHLQVGGDYYDYIPLNEDEFVFCVADVSGKGASAALLMSNFQANLNAVLKYAKDISLPELIVVLNDRVMENAQGEKFITLFIGKYNIRTRKLLSVNAGHNHPILTDGNKVHFFTKGCIGLGMFETIPSIEMEEIEVPPRSTIVCYTDGLVELENDEKKDFGTQHLVHLIRNHLHITMEDLNGKIFEEAETFKQNQPWIDDIAVLSLRLY